MGYAYYIINGRECGYAVPAECDESGCGAKIDRGLAYCCGETPGGTEWGCGDYFCGKHLFIVDREFGGQLCARCMELIQERLDERDEQITYPQSADNG